MPAVSNTPFSYSKLFSKAISNALNVPLLLWQGMLLAISLVLFVIFTAFMGQMIFFTVMLAFGSGFFPFALFMIIFGIAVWLMGILAINAFMNGVQFHLAMQAISKRPLDIDLAWKLSSARWRDAFFVQGSMIGFFVGITILALVVSIVVAGNANAMLTILNPAQWSQAGFPGVLAAFLAVVALLPFLLMMLPIVYFEQTKPTHIVQKLRDYVRPHYFQLLGTIVLLLVLNLVVTTIADYITTVPVSQTPLRETALTFVVFSGFALLVQLLALLFTYTINLNAQTLLYLHIGKPKENTQFVTMGKFSTALSNLARSHPSHAGLLPVKWKKLGGKNKK